MARTDDGHRPTGTPTEPPSTLLAPEVSRGSGQTRLGAPAAAAETSGSRRGSAGSWFAIGFSLALGAALALLLVEAVLRAAGVLVLVLVSMLVAVTLEPVVVWLTRRRLRRGWAVTVVVVLFAAAVAGFLALVIPPVTTEVTAFVGAVPGWLQKLHDHHSTLGAFEDHYHVVEKAQRQLTAGGTSSALARGALGAGQLVLSAVTASVVVIIVTLYLLAGLPAIKGFCYRCVPGSRRAGVQDLTEKALSRVGRFMLGNVLTSVIAGAATFAWLMILGVPYAAALGIFVALMDMVPMVGSTVAGVLISLVALTVSLPVALATVSFFLVYRLFEDYLLVPRVMKRAVAVHPIVTVLAVLLGGALLGVIGALVAIPVAVTIGLILDQVVFPKVDRI